MTEIYRVEVALRHMYTRVHGNGSNDEKKTKLKKKKNKSFFSTDGPEIRLSESFGCRKSSPERTPKKFLKRLRYLGLKFGVGHRARLYISITRCGDFEISTTRQRLFHWS